MAVADNARCDIVQCYPATTKLISSTRKWRNGCSGSKEWSLECWVFPLLANFASTSTHTLSLVNLTFGCMENCSYYHEHVGSSVGDQGSNLTVSKISILLGRRGWDLLDLGISDLLWEPPRGNSFYLFQYCWGGGVETY